MGYWALQILGWGFYFYAQASGEVIFASQPWDKASLLWGGVSLTGVALTQGLRWWLGRRQWLALPPRALIWRILAATVVIALASHAATIALSQAVYDSTVAPLYASFYERLLPHQQLRNQLIFTLLVYAGWVAIYLSFASLRHRYRADLRQAQLSEALRSAELRLLKSQLNPHFLFNSLNGLRSLIADEPDRARDAVTHLARMLRYSLASGEEDLVSLERELEMVDDYLALESLRFADRLRVEKDLDAAARIARIPAMLLQTLVENGIKHGIAPLKDGGTLKIHARMADEELLLQVVNPRPDPAVLIESSGVGLRNATERLRLLFGARASLRLDLDQPGVAIAKLRLPA